MYIYMLSVIVFVCGFGCLFVCCDVVVVFGVCVLMLLRGVFVGSRCFHLCVNICCIWLCVFSLIVGCFCCVCSRDHVVSVFCDVVALCVLQLRIYICCV